MEPMWIAAAAPPVGIAAQIGVVGMGAGVADLVQFGQLAARPGAA